MPEMTEEDALQRARAGATWFDLNLDSGWLARVEPDYIDVDDCSRCPLSQATDLPYSDATDRYALRHSDCDRLGFTCNGGDSETLDAAWRIALAERANPNCKLIVALKAELIDRQPADLTEARALFHDALSHDPVAETIRMAGGKGAWSVEPDGSALWFVPVTHPVVLIDRDILAPRSREAFAAYAASLQPRGSLAICNVVKDLIRRLEQETAR